jgi:4-aminobutyrate aminotransferase
MDRDTAEPRVEGVPGERAREWVARYGANAAPSTYVYDFVWDPSRPAIGPFCTDADSNVFLDFTSHVGAAPLGYNSPLILDPMAEFDLVDPLKIAGHDFYLGFGDAGEPDLPGPAGLMDRLVAASDEYDLDRIFLSNSGAEAVENAIKVCYSASGGTYGITFEGAFHGRTLGALSLNRSKSVYREGFPELAGVHDVPFCRDRGCAPETCGCGFFVEGPGELASTLRRALDPEFGFIDPDSVAYLIVEPIQGEGGYRFPSDAFAAELEALRREHDFLLVADEIQSGMGRTGEFWGVDHYPIEPDVITAAKGLRVGATISRADVFPTRESRLSSTWGAGDLLASMQGALTIDAIFEEGLLRNARVRGEGFKERLRDEAPASVVDVRGKGLMLAVEFDSGERRDDAIEAALARGLLTLGCGRKTVRVLPPLDVTEREIDLGIDLLIAAIETL